VIAASSNPMAPFWQISAEFGQTRLLPGINAGTSLFSVYPVDKQNLIT
jgi:hypothetical protein